MAGDERIRVIVGVSRSTSGLRALRLAVAEARRRNAVLHAVRAYPDAAVAGAWPGPSPEQADELDARKVVVHAFDDTMGGQPPDIDLVVVLLAGRPERVLVNCADRDDDLLVVGVARRPWWRNAWRPARTRVAGYCVRHARCPVQVVPPDSFARSAMRAGFARRIRKDLSALTGS